MPISSMLLIVTTAAALVLPSFPQSGHPTPTSAFDVASVKPNKTEGLQRSNVPLDTGNVYAALDPEDKRTAASGYFVATNQPLWRYITFAYKLSGTQELALRFSFFEGLKSQAPSWVTGTFTSSAERFNIEARAPENSTIDEMRLMMQALLADRFHLVAHFESREAPVFGLVLVHRGTTGPNLRPHPVEDKCNNSFQSPTHPSLSGFISSIGEVPPVCGVIAHVLSSQHTNNSFGGRRVSLGLLATSLPTMTGMATIPRPVVDQTGVLGDYDFSLSWSTSSDPDTSDNDALFREALRGQLGLELRPGRAPISILVVDHVERPSANE